MTAVLSGAGFGVDFACDTEDGLHQLAVRDYDLAVVLENHDSESWQLCQRIRKLTAIPLIVIGANASPETCARAIYAGADLFIRKPFGPREFLARVNSLLRRSSPRQAVPVG